MTTEARSRPVREIMNKTLLYVREGDRLTMVRSKILAFGVTGVPVLDEDPRPVGFVSLRDLATDGEAVSSPVLTISESASIEDAAAKLAASKLRRMVVVDERGVAVGIVSAIDLLRAFVGMGPWHPTRFDVTPTWSGES